MIWHIIKYFYNRQQIPLEVALFSPALPMITVVSRFIHTPSRSFIIYTNRLN
ncbi:MAG: hypothetical protein HPY66_0429 [Firmicutes bacterium]|nr:hypothetical protein [Bacillota bacterium]